MEQMPLLNRLFFFLSCRHSNHLALIGFKFMCLLSMFCPHQGEVLLSDKREVW